jgi:hypothetical protein
MISWSKKILKPIGLSVLTVLLLTNCKQSDSKITKHAFQNQRDLILETLFFYSINELKQRFGESNIQTEYTEACETCGPEGGPLEESFYTTTIFPNSKNEAHIDWDSYQTKVTRVSVSYSEGNEWRTKEGFRLGDSISKINSFYKNKPVQMLFVNEYYYSVNDYYSLSFNSDKIIDSDNLMSTDLNLKNLVLQSIDIRVPGYSE